MNIKNIFFHFYLKCYLLLHKNQLQKIDSLNHIPKTFLVISNTALGDAILSTPAIKSLKKSFPNSKIVALIHKNYIPLFKDFEYIDTIIPFYGGYKNIFKTIKEIKKYSPEMAMIFHGNGPQDIQICIYSGCNYILKHVNHSPLKRYLSFEFKKGNQHIIEERVELVRKIGGTKIDLTLEVPKLNNLELLAKYKKYSNYIGFQIGASEQYRIWPIDNFAKLANKLFEKNENILATGTKNESSMVQRIDTNLKKQIINLCGETPIDELPYLIKVLKVLITTDTGTMHLAFALKTPTICLFSPSNPKYTGPYQDLTIHSVIKKNGEFVNNVPKKQRSNAAMELISVQDVYDELMIMGYIK